jgi:hypothetical protein
MFISSLHNIKSKKIQKNLWKKMKGIGFEWRLSMLDCPKIGG